MTNVKTGLVRLTYVHLDKPYAFEEDSTPKYSTGMIISKDDKYTIDQIKKSYEEAVEHGVEKFGQSFKTRVTPLLRAPGGEGLLIDGDQDERYADSPEYKNSWILTAKSATPLLIMAVEKGKRKLEPEEIAEMVYSGCYAKVLFNFYPYNKIKKGIACGLNSLCKIKDGDSLSGFKASVADWEDEIDQAVTDSLGDDYGDLL